MHNFLSF